MTPLPLLALILLALMAALVLAIFIHSLVEGTRAEKLARWTIVAIAVAFITVLVGAADVPL